MVSIVFLLMCVTPVHAYYFGQWKTDGFFKSQFGVFTEKKPYNKAQYGFSDDNISTARQSFRWNLEGQISEQFALRAEVQGIWEPDYPGETGVITSSPTRFIEANYYNSLDWRELTLEYKPNYSHSIKFGRQIINWGEALSGRVLDQCNPADSRASAGFLGLEEIYIPLWMFRGQHDFYAFYSTSIEWIAAPVWRADRFETGRGADSDTPVGNGKTTNVIDLVGKSLAAAAYRNDPGARFSVKRDNRIEKVWGADVSLNVLGLPGSILGAPYSTSYHGSDMLPGYTPGDKIEPLSYTDARANILPTYYGVGSTYAYIDRISDPDTTYVFLSESPTFIATKYRDHNFKNTRWGFKTKSQVGNVEGGIAFYQGPGSVITKIVGYIPGSAPGWQTKTGYVVYQYQVPRYNTYGLYGNVSAWGTKFFLEAAYQPDILYHKNLMGIGFGTQSDGDGGYEPNPDVWNQRDHNMEEVDVLTTLWGVSREQNIPILNEFNPFSINFQYTNTYRMESTDGLAAAAPFFWELDRMSHSFLLAISTSYSYRKYNPGLTLAYDPSGCGLVSASMTYVPEGFNSRLKFSLNVSNYWTGNQLAGGLALYDNNDSVTLGMQYDFY